jgi:hypothetical protein
MPARPDRKPGVQDPAVKTEGELAPDGDFVREEIAQRYISSDPVNANAPPSTGGRLPEVADRPGPGPLPAQGHEPGIAGPATLTGGVRIDEAGELVTDRGVPLPAGEAARVLARLKERYDLAAAANATTDETPVPVVPAGAKANTKPQFPGAARRLGVHDGSGHANPAGQGPGRPGGRRLAADPARPPGSAV